VAEEEDAEDDDAEDDDDADDADDDALLPLAEEEDEEDDDAEEEEDAVLPMLAEELGDPLPPWPPSPPGRIGSSPVAQAIIPRAAKTKTAANLRWTLMP